MKQKLIEILKCLGIGFLIVFCLLFITFITLLIQPFGEIFILVLVFSALVYGLRNTF